MTMNAMVAYLESKGFKVHKKYSSTERAYEFTIERNGLNLTGWFEYKGDGKTIWKAQEDFLDKLVRDFEQAEKEKKSMKNIAFDISRDGPVGKLVIKDNVYDVCVKEVDSYSSPSTTNKCYTDGTERIKIHPSGVLSRSASAPWPLSRKDSINEGKVQIKDVIFNPPATIVFWSDDSKTVVKQYDETYDPEKGLAMAISKKSLGNQGNYFETFKKYVEPYKKKIEDEEQAELDRYLEAARAAMNDNKLYYIWYKSEDGTETVYTKGYIKEGNAVRVARKIFADTSTEWLVAKEDPFKNGVWDKAFGSDS